MALDKSLLEPMDYEEMDKIEIPVKYGNREFILREASGADGRTFRNAQTARVQFGAEGKPKNITNGGDLPPLLVSLCIREVLYKQDGGAKVRAGEKALTPDEVCFTFNDSFLQKLFERAKRISGLEGDATDTPESLRKQIGELEKRLRDIENGDDKDPTRD